MLVLQTAVFLLPLLCGIHAFGVVPGNCVPEQRLTSSYSPSSTSLSMGLFDRFTRVAKSNLNNILKYLEDPEKIMSQALEDMQVIC